jgi:group I intron endonuclease
MKGKNHTLEAKVKMSEARLGLKLTEETKLKMSAAKLGTKHSEEAKAKMFEAKKDKAVKLEVTDILSNEITIYSSMKAAARALGIPQSTISSYFRINQKSPYKKQYIFKKV